MSDTPLAIGLDFGGTSVKAAVVYKHTIIDQTAPLATREFDSSSSLMEAIFSSVEELLARHRSIGAVGIGVPGFVDFQQGRVRRLTNVENWENVPIKQLCEDRFSLPTTVENDANCMAYAEWRQGAGRGYRHLVCVVMGTGIGGGIIANGQLIRGAQCCAGEIGQTTIDHRGRVGQFGNQGALEDYIGNRQIAKMAQQHYQDQGVEKTLEECTPHLLARAAHRGDPVALELWDEIGRLLAAGVRNCCWLLNPEALIIGGGVARAGDLLFEPLCTHLFAELSDPFKEHLRVLPARFGHESGMIGAASLALDQARMPDPMQMI